MYRIDDTVSALKEVQRLLNVNQTGIYDTSTKKAVEQIQLNYGLKRADVVNYKTFNAILAEYNKREMRELNSNYLFKPVFPYTIGDMDDNVGLINDALRLVLSDYVYEDAAPRGNYLNKNTITASNFLRKIFKMDLSDQLDELFIKRLLLEKSAIEIKRKYS